MTTASDIDKINARFKKLEAALNIDLRDEDEIAAALAETAKAEEHAQQVAAKAAEEERQRLIDVDKANVKASQELAAQQKKELKAGDRGLHTAGGTRQTGTAGSAGGATAGPRNNPTAITQSNDSEALAHDEKPVAGDKTQSGTGTPTPKPAK